MKKKNICGNNIKVLREHANLSQESLVTLMNSLGSKITLPYLIEMENFERKVYDYDIVCLCKIFNISTDVLLKEKIAKK